jgi:hypothetical protein
MNTILKKLISRGIILLALPFLVSSCEKDLDHPPLKELNLDALMTVQDLRDMHPGTGQSVTINGDANIFAVVTMDENTGNIHRGLFVQDHTAGINLRLTRTSLFNVGDSVRIALDGTVLSDYNNMLQLDNIDPGVNIVKQASNRNIEPKQLTIPEITSAIQGQLIRLEGVQFAFGDVGLPYADAPNQTTLNRNLEDCDGNGIIVRTSGFADFATELVPEGNGSLVAIVSQFGTTMQLLLRTTDEVNMEEERCPPPGGDLELITIAEIRQLFAQGTTSIPPNRRLEGVVISDRNYSNHPGQNAYIMDDNGDGIALRFQNFHSLNYSNQVRVIVSNLPLNSFNGLLQIEMIPTGNAFAIGQGTVPEPQVTTIQNLRNNFSQYESTLVHIENVTIPAGGTYAGNILLNDGTGTVNMYTYNWASFANTPVQPGIFNVTAIASIYHNPQLLIRSLDDLEFVSEGGNDVDPVTSINEDFQGYANFEEIDKNGWKTIAEVGNRRWICRTFDGNHYAQATAFNSPDPVNIMWMITPPVDLDASSAPVLQFQSAHEFLSHDGVGVYISVDFDGNDVTTATWEPLPATLAGPANPNHQWVNSGIIDLNDYSGIVYIAWRYEGSHPQGQNGSFRIDNVQLYDDPK